MQLKKKVLRNFQGELSYQRESNQNDVTGKMGYLRDNTFPEVTFSLIKWILRGCFKDLIQIQHDEVLGQLIFKVSSNL